MGQRPRRRTGGERAGPRLRETGKRLGSASGPASDAPQCISAGGCCVIGRLPARSQQVGRGRRGGRGLGRDARGSDGWGRVRLARVVEEATRGGSTSGCAGTGGGSSRVRRSAGQGASPGGMAGPTPPAKAARGQGGRHAATRAGGGPVAEDTDAATALQPNLAPARASVAIATVITLGRSAARPGSLASRSSLKDGRRSTTTT